MRLHRLMGAALLVPMLGCPGQTSGPRDAAVDAPVIAFADRPPADAVTDRVRSDAKPPVLLAAGRYRLPSGSIYFSDGAGKVCGYASWSDYLMDGGPPDLRGVQDLAALPAGIGAPPSCKVAYPETQASQKPLCEDCVSFRVSAPVAYVWPTGQSSQAAMPDSLFTVVALSGQSFVGYIADLSTYALSATSVLGLNVQSISATPVLGPGTQGQFDECGSWIHGAELSGTSVRAWYHAEAGYCHGEGASANPLKSVAYAEGPADGMSFARKGYPQNLVLSGTPQELAQGAATHVTAGDGDFSVVRQGNFHFMFFINALTGQSGVAAAQVANGGMPGSWLKWHGGKYSEPGVGGASSDLGPLLAGVSYNTTVERFVAMTYQNGLGVGFRVAVSPDATTWKVIDAPLIPTGTRWGDMPANPTGYAQYPSIIAPDGSKHWSSTFYLYYLYVRPGETFATRFGAVSQVTASVGATPVSGPRVSTALESYYSSSAGKHWITSGLAIPKQGVWDFKDQGPLGAVFTMPGAGLIELDDCVYGTANYLVSTGGSCDSPSITKLRPIGWIYSSAGPQPAKTHPIYRCYSAAADDHFVSVDAGCGGATTESLLGYALDYP